MLKRPSSLVFLQMHTTRHVVYIWLCFSFVMLFLGYNGHYLAQIIFSYFHLGLKEYCCITLVLKREHFKDSKS